MNSPNAGPERPPVVAVVPRAARSDADDAIFLASSYGLTPHVWQSNVLRAWLGVSRDGLWAASTCGLAVPRQNGKNALIEMRELFGMVILGERVLHTAHQVKTARKAFLRIASFFENARQYPELAAMVKEIRKTNGQEAIVLDNGGSVEFVARSKGSARGFTVDILVCDEAQDLTDEELAALYPTTAAAPLGNPQLIVTGTPPDPEKGETGEVFTRVRQQALKGENKRICWIDYGSDGPMPDVDDRALWMARNPSCGLPFGTSMEALADFRAVMAPENFAREFLGWWGDPDADLSGAFPVGTWTRAQVSERPQKPGAIGLAVSLDQAYGSISAAAKADRRRIHVDAVDRRPGTVWLIAEAARIQREHGCEVAIDEKGPAADLIPALEAAGVRLRKATTSDYLDACASFYRGITEEPSSITHGGSDELNIAVAGARRRDVGDRWAWGRKTSTTDVSMLEAATLAAWCASKPKVTATAW